MSTFNGIILLAISGSSICFARTIHDRTNSFDVFPLKSHLHYIYDYHSDRSTTWLLYVEELEVDSGSVDYVVRDSIVSGDSTLVWNVEERQALWHRLYSGYSYPPRDTTFWTYDTVVFAVSENTVGSHELSASSLVWDFPIKFPDTTARSVNRFSDSSSALIVKYWSAYTPDCGNGEDSIWFSDSTGLYHRESWSFYGGCHNTHTSVHTTVRLHGNSVLSVLESGHVPSTIDLKQNYPNPFNPSTEIEYVLSKSSPVSLRLYDLLGRELEILFDGYQAAGRYSTLLILGDLPSGVYFYRLSAGSFVRTRKLVLMK